MPGSSTPKDVGIVSSITTAAAIPTGMPPPPPPGKSGVAAVSRLATVWNNSQIVNALWCINEDRNSWMGIAGVGWVRLSNGSDSGVVALTVLASHAKGLQSPINYRQESDGMAHEIYAW
jgi:hypothetical protein